MLHLAVLELLQQNWPNYAEAQQQLEVLNKIKAKAHKLTLTIQELEAELVSLGDDSSEQSCDDDQEEDEDFKSVRAKLYSALVNGVNELRKQNWIGSEWASKELDVLLALEIQMDDLGERERNLSDRIIEHQEYLEEISHTKRKRSDDDDEDEEDK